MKNLKVSNEIHTALKKRAVENNVGIKELVEYILKEALGL